jgi:N-formylglutamate amidohydrolase
MLLACAINPQLKPRPRTLAQKQAIATHKPKPYPVADMNSETPSFAVQGPVRPLVPILLSVPHAGRNYPAQLGAMVRVPLASFASLEDRFADLLVTEATTAGARSITANTPRLWIDLNRAETDIDPAMINGFVRHGQPISAKARGGLGLIPRRTSALGDLWVSKLDAEDVGARIETVHRPYHHAIEQQLNALRSAFGTAILLDVHSMPPLDKGKDGEAAQIVIGDRHGKSASNRFTSLVGQIFADAGLRVAMNFPYPGNYIIERHGSPAHGIHALQIEICRSLYLDPALDQPGEGLPFVRHVLKHIVDALSVEVAGTLTAIAAE